MTSERVRDGLFMPDLPFHMVWLATDACHLRCRHCSSSAARRSRDELATREAVDMIDQLIDCGTVDLGISGGEPFLRHDLFEIISHAKRRGMSVGVASHGAKFPRDRASRLAGLGVDRLQFSLDGPASCHESLRRCPGLFERVRKSIATAQKAGLRVHICCTINRLNADRLEPFVEFLSEIGVDRLNFSRFVPTGRGSHALDLQPEEWRRVIAHCSHLTRRYQGRLEIVSHLAQQILVDDSLVDMSGFIGCQAGRGQGCITANGTVFPCVLLPIPVGNIRQAPFRTIWESSPVIRELQDRSRLEGACGRCLVRSRCGGCRAVAYAQTGRYLGEDPRCWIGEDRALSLCPH